MRAKYVLQRYYVILIINKHPKRCQTRSLSEVLCIMYFKMFSERRINMFIPMMSFEARPFRIRIDWFLVHNQDSHIIFLHTPSIQQFQLQLTPLQKKIFFFFRYHLKKIRRNVNFEMNRRVGNSLPSLIMESVEKTCSKHSEIMLHICCFDVIYSLELLLWLLRAPRRYQRGRNWKLTPIGQEAEQLLH